MLFYHKITDDLYLELWNDSLTEDYYRIVSENTRYFIENISWVHEGYTLDEARASVNNHIKCFAEGTRIYCAIWYQGEVVGLCGLHGIDKKYKKCEIGFWIAEKYAGKGIMTQCINEIIQIGFDELGLKRIAADTVVTNKATQKVLEKCGFKYEGTMKNYYMTNGVIVDSMLYAITK